MGGCHSQYEGALRVVANDPVGQERVETIWRVQAGHRSGAGAVEYARRFAVGAGDTATERAGISARVRQLLPNSKRLAQITLDANTRLGMIKAQLKDQAQAAYSRAQRYGR
ncbi:MAG: hypothetical protein U0694_16600 [Anaerolineae bacterium]